MDQNPQQVVDRRAERDPAIPQVNRICGRHYVPVVLESDEAPVRRKKTDENRLRHGNDDEEEKQAQCRGEERRPQHALGKRGEGARWAPLRPHGAAASMSASTVSSCVGSAHRSCSLLQNTVWNVPPIVSSRSDRISLPSSSLATPASTTGYAVIGTPVTVAR